MIPILLAMAAVAAPQSDRLPPAKPLPMAVDGEEGAVMRSVSALLRAIERGDGPALLATVNADGAATVVADGRPPRTMRWADLASGLKPDNSRAEERLGTPAIEFDGDVAMVWAPYTFLVNGAAHHCGYDHFDLVRQAGSWKVLNVTWSQRTAGCTAP